MVESKVVLGPGEGMSKEHNLDHEFLELHSGILADRTFMGGYRLSQRTRLFFLSGLLAIVGFAGIFVAADREVTSAIDNWSRTERLSALVTTMEKGIAGARGEEKRFLLKKDPVIAEAFKVHFDSTSKALETLSRMQESVTVEKHAATIRDGLAQYNQQFTKLVSSEKALGLSDGSGLSRELQDVTERLQAGFSKAGYTNLAGQVSRINQEGQKTLLSGYKKGVGEIQKRYQTLIALLKKTKIPDKQKTSLQELLQSHETKMLKMINARFAFEDETRRFDDIITYLTPSLTALTGFSDNAGSVAADKLLQAQRFARLVIGGGSAGILVALTFIGLMVMGSVNSSIRDLAVAASRLADGDHDVAIPAQGNSDSVGNLARAMDRWLDNLADLDQMRQELDHTRARLEQVLAEAVAVDAAEAARAALLEDDTEEDAAESLPGRYQGLIGVEDSGISQGGPISSVSRQLASFSQYVTATANNVERTEALIKGLDDATRQIDEMGSLVTAIRDQTNLLAFRAGPREAGGDNLVILSGEDKEPAENSPFPDVDMAKRFDAIRGVTDRAERTALSVRNTMENVNATAYEIAATASSQALEATSRLLSQSEYLHNMLDDVISRITPARPGELSEEEKSQRDSKKSKDKSKPPPKMV